MTPAAVVDRYGIPPERYPDLAALVGESSDNLPGVPGVGPKTAAKWLTTYGSLGDLVARVDEIKGKVGDSLREHLAQVLLNRQVNQLVRDLPLPVEPDELRWQSWDRERVHQVFDTLQFRVLRDRLYDYLAPSAPGAEEGFEIEHHVLAPGGVTDWLATHASGAGRTGLHVHGSPGERARATSAGSRWPPPTARASRSTLRGSRPRTRRPSSSGSPTRRDSRCCTMPRDRCLRWRPAAGHSLGSPPTPSCRRSSSCQDSGHTSCPTWCCAS